MKIIATRIAKPTVAIKPKFSFALGRFSKLVVFLTVEITFESSWKSSLKSDLDRLNWTVTTKARLGFWGDVGCSRQICSWQRDVRDKL